MNEFSFTITTDSPITSVQEAEKLARRFLRDECKVSIGAFEVEMLDTTKFGDTWRTVVPGRHTVSGTAVPS